MTGALLALLSAASFGLNNAMFRRGVLSGSVLQALAITVPLGVPLFALGCLGFGAFGALSGLAPASWAWMSTAGVIHFVVGVQLVEVRRGASGDPFNFSACQHVDVRQRIDAFDFEFSHRFTTDSTVGAGYMSGFE